MSDFRKLSENVFASPQITIADIAAAKELGVGLIVNNRPEGEAPDQTPGNVIERAAKEAGLAYRAIPIDQSGFSQEQIAEMVEAVRGAEGGVLAYCRSGTRSTYLWALAAASQGEDPAAIKAAANAAGYDVSPLRETLERLSAEASK